MGISVTFSLRLSTMIPATFLLVILVSINGYPNTGYKEKKDIPLSYSSSDRDSNTGYKEKKDIPLSHSSSDRWSYSCDYPAGHTMTKYSGPAKTCVEKTIHSGFDQAAKDVIVKVHNELRNKVAMGNETHGAQPQAANMMKMVWDDELAEIAQRWTDQCIFGHDGNRNTCDGLYVGQNGYWGASSAEMSPYSALGVSEDAVRSWYNEVKKPGFDSSHVSPFVWDKGAGHYTQVVWAETDMVGCGLRYYKDGGWFATLIYCNYGIGGNMVGVESNMYLPGIPCSMCPPDSFCDSTFTGLCTYY